MGSARNNKRKIIIFVGIIVVVVISVLSLFLLFGDNDGEEGKEYLYGTFEYINDNGDKSVIKIEKNSVYMENADYEGYEYVNAMFMLAEQEEENDTIENVDIETDKAQREEKIREICDNVDFRELFDKKANKYEIENYDYPNGSYQCVLSASEDEKYQIRITVDYKNKTCRPLGKKTVNYTYVS